MEPNQKSTPNQNPSPTPVTIPVSTPPQKRNYLPWLIGGGVVMLLLLIIVGLFVGLAVIQSMFRYTPPPPEPPPTPEVVISPIIGKFASDSGILRLRDQLKEIRQSIDTVDLIEPQISPPALDLNIKIE